MDLSVIRPLVQLLAVPVSEKVRCFPSLADGTTFAMSEADASFESTQEFVVSAAEDAIRSLLGQVEMGFPDAPSLSDEQLKCLNDLYGPLDDVAEWNVPDADVRNSSSAWWADVEQRAKDCLNAFGWSASDALDVLAREVIDEWKDE